MTKRAHTSLSAVWLRPDGHEMTPPDWRNEQVRCLGMLLALLRRSLAVAS
jgi:hypothetical protein